MLKHKKIDQVCCTILALTMLLTILFMNGQSLGIAKAGSAMGYESRLFDPSRVHTIDIVMDDWDGFLKTCTNEEYSACSVLIDGEAYKNIAIRAKGNTSLSSVAAYGNNRYSFKLEFDQYDPGKRYHGLDKVSLNNLIQDTTCLKDFLSYSLMKKMGVTTPLCSFVWITVNGQAWGLYLAVEGVEESFLQRNYGKSYGNLYKPDSLSFGGGRGNGAGFQFGQFAEEFQDGSDSSQNTQSGSDASSFQFPGNFTPPDGAFDPSKMPQGDGMPSFDGQMPTMLKAGDSTESFGGGNFPGGMGGIGSDDVKLKYIDEAVESYANIFNSSKIKVSEADKKRLIRSLKTLSEGKNIDSVVNVDAVIRYLAVHNFLCNGDSYTGMMVHNYYLYEKDGVLSLIPWDYNLAFGAFNMGGFGGSSSSGAVSSINAPIDSPVSSDSLSERPMIAWIFESEAYTLQYHQVYNQFMDDVFASGYFEQMLDETLTLISPYVKKDPTAFYTYEEFEKGTSALRQFCLKRAQSVTGQLEGAIPSTTQGQSADSSSLIDASGIQISDMGGMSMGDMSMGGKGVDQNWSGSPTSSQVSNSEAPGVSPAIDQKIPASGPSSSSAPATKTTGSKTGSGMPKTGRIGFQSSNSIPEAQATASPASTNNGDRSFPAVNAAMSTETTATPGKNPTDATSDRSGTKNPAGSRESFSFGGTRAQAAGPASASDWLLLGASASVLLVGLFIAAFYKKRW